MGYEVTATAYVGVVIKVKNFKTLFMSRITEKEKKELKDRKDNEVIYLEELPYYGFIETIVKNANKEFKTSFLIQDISCFENYNGPDEYCEKKLWQHVVCLYIDRLSVSVDLCGHDACGDVSHRGNYDAMNNNEINAIYSVINKLGLDPIHYPIQIVTHLHGG
jgi:hypothetical protein